MQLPANVELPLIVHASYSGGGNFVVNSRTADGVDTGVVANSLRTYEGTFPIGFVDPKNAPTAALHVVADGPWHLDIAPAALAPRLESGGVRGDGDAVLVYPGPKARFHVTHTGDSSFVLRTYGNANLTFARAAGGADGVVTFAAGPLFIAVTTVGVWSIAPA